MTAIRVRGVLAPDETRALFSEPDGAGFDPVFYRLAPHSIGDRLARKLGRALPSRVRVDAGADLSRVSALWIGGAADFTRAETAALLELLPRLEWVYAQRTGVETLPLDLYRGRGVAVSNSGQLTSLWVAEMNLACVLAHAKQLPAHQELQRRREWRPLPARELGGFEVLIVGTGAIGGHTARLCRAAGMRVTGASRRPERLLGEQHEFARLLPLDDALRHEIRTADAVVLAVPLTDATRALMSGDVLRRMRRDAALINLARPRVVDERALLAALRAGVIGAAWVSRLEDVGRWEAWRADRLPGFHLTHVSEANVAAKLPQAFAQFRTLSARQLAGDVGFRIA